MPLLVFNQLVRLKLQAEIQLVWQCKK